MQILFADNNVNIDEIFFNSFTIPSYGSCQGVGQTEQNPVRVWVGILGLLEFGLWVKVGLGKCIETMPLSGPGVPDFRVWTCGDNFWTGVQIGLRVQMGEQRASQIECKDRYRVQSIQTTEYTTEVHSLFTKSLGVSSYQDQMLVAMECVSEIRYRTDYRTLEQKLGSES